MALPAPIFIPVRIHGIASGEHQSQDEDRHHSPPHDPYMLTARKGPEDPTFISIRHLRLRTSQGCVTFPIQIGVSFVFSIRRVLRPIRAEFNESRHKVVRPFVKTCYGRTQRFISGGGPQHSVELLLYGTDSVKPFHHIYVSGTVPPGNHVTPCYY